MRFGASFSFLLPNGGGNIELIASRRFWLVASLTVGGMARKCAPPHTDTPSLGRMV
jgi:hypothetical protein